MTDNLAPIILELRRAFGTLATDVFGKVYPEAVMPMPVINIPHKDTRRKGVSWYAPDRWASESAETLAIFAGGNEIESMSEICLAAEALAETDTTILTLLTHEMVHHFAHSNGRKDTSGWHYHNGTFAAIAGAIGLEVVTDGAGHIETQTAGDRLRKVYGEINLDSSVFDLYRKRVDEKSRPGSKLKKWECSGKCGLIIRASRYLVARCEICDAPFIYADKDADTPEVVRWLRAEKDRYKIYKSVLSGPIGRRGKR